ncbi:hypothetical protein QBC39DRAFT_126003 [Podospora conica]|nr:hypothetical protein QBC39DRAFT_126003 [Schizothecium conicum]
MSVRACLKEAFVIDNHSTLGHYIKFEPSAYRAQISSLGLDELQALHKKTQCKLVGIAAQFTAGLLVFSPLSFLVSAPIMSRRAHVNEEKRLVIKEIMAERGWKGHHFGKKDFFVGAAPTVVAAGLAPVVNHVVHHVAEHATQHVHGLAEAAAQNGVGDVVSDEARMRAAVDLTELAVHKGAPKAIKKGTSWVLTKGEKGSKKKSENS